MARKRDVDWEEQLASIIERSDKHLHQLSSEYSKVKANRPTHREYNVNARSVSNCPQMQTTSFQSRNTNERIEGIHERAAYVAFNTAVTRPTSRSSNDELMRRVELRTMQTVERALNEKLTSTSKAIDALRDQICLVNNEVRDLNNQASRTSTSLTAQERRLDVICHDFDTKRDEINSIEGRIAIETSNLKREMKSLLHSSKSDIKMNLTASLRGTILDELDADLNNKLATMRSSLMKTIPDAVDTQINRLKKECLEVLETNGNQLAIVLKQNLNDQADTQRREVVDMITKIVTVTATELEKSMMSEVTRKLEEMMASKVMSSNEEVATLQEAVTLQKNELSLLKGETKKVSQIDSFSNEMAKLQERMNSLQDNQCRNDTDIMSAFNYISEHKQLIKGMNERLLTEEEVKNIAEQTVDEKENIFNSSADDFVDYQTLNAAKSELVDKSAELDQRLSKIQSKTESMTADMTNMLNLEERLDELEYDFKSKLNAMLNAVESFEQRVKDLENRDDPGEILSDCQEALALSKSEFIAAANAIRDQTTEDVIHIRNDLKRISKQLNEIDTDCVHSHFCEHETNNNDDGSMVKSLRDLHATLIEAKEAGDNNDKRDSVVSQQQIQMEQPEIKSPVPNTNKAEDMASPCVHLMGLGSPGSITTSDSLSLASPRLSPHSNETDPKRLSFASRDIVSASRSNNDGEDKSTSIENRVQTLPEVDISMHADMTNESDTPRSSDTKLCSILTSEALSLCGETASVGNLMSREKHSLSHETITPRDDGSSHLGSLTSFDHAELVNNAAPVVNTTEPLICVTDDHSASASASSHKNESSPKEDDGSILGSITSFDEVELILSPSPDAEVARKSMIYINSVDLDVYEIWEEVLTELVQTLGPRHDIVSYDVNNESTITYESSFDSES